MKGRLLDNKAKHVRSHGAGIGHGYDPFPQTRAVGTGDAQPRRSHSVGESIHAVSAQGAR